MGYEVGGKREWSREVRPDDVDYGISYVTSWDDERNPDRYAYHDDAGDDLVEVECDDCGDLMKTAFPDDSKHICPDCGIDREFKHGTGRFYDAFG